MAVMPSPEEMQMEETRRRLRKLGYSDEIENSGHTDDMDKLMILSAVQPWRMVPASKRKSDERKDTKTKEAPFPGEFTPLRI